MKLLSRTEEIILAAIYKLEGNAYGVTIIEHINSGPKLNWKFSAIYSPLSRLVESGYISSTEGEAVAERDGRKRIFYVVTKSGVNALKEIQDVNNAVWVDMPAIK